MTARFRLHLPGRSACLLALLCANLHVHAQDRTPIARPKPLPSDVTPAVQISQCGDLTRGGHYGPFDFRRAHPNDRRLVEGTHFDMELQTFMAGRVEGRNGAGTGAVGGGFDYTLKSFPNHPIALKVVEELGRRLNTEQPRGMEFPLECYYVRAFMIAPDDSAVRALYGVYLSYRKRDREALHHLEVADQALNYSRTMQYLIGEARMRLGEFELAQINAMRAAKLGFPSDALQTALRSAGHWNNNLKLPDESSASAVETAASGNADGSGR